MGEVKPTWLRVNVSSQDCDGMKSLTGALATHSLHTVCRSAHCPNLPQCWGARTATFLLLGDACTRNCGFCAVPTGWPDGALDGGEPARVADAASALGLRYVVLTSVDRDDLADGGADQFAATVHAVRRRIPEVAVEVLIPDYTGAPLQQVLQARPSVVGHNLETVRRLTAKVRDPRAGYARSLEVLAEVKQRNAVQLTKSSILLGLGEDPEEVHQAMEDLHSVGVDLVVLGQYLRPTPRQLPVARYVAPREFAELADEAHAMGFRGVVAAPLARTSYEAAALYQQLR